MRIIGLILTLLGGIGLGSEGFNKLTRNQSDDVVQQRRQRFDGVWVPPVFSGIVLVSGLLLMTSGERRTRE